MRKVLSSLIGAAALLLMSESVHADVIVRFHEAAPKDKFVISNRSNCKLADGSMIFDLRPTTAGLLFDTAPSGPGENVAQPFEIARSSGVTVSSLPVPDGASIAELRFGNFTPEGEVEVTVDVDDSVPSGPRGVQMIDPSEIAGARVVISMRSRTFPAGVFDRRGVARIKLTACPNS